MSDHITLVGNIVSDPEERATRGGDAIAAFRLAVSERRYDRDKGQWVDGHTNYYAVSAFGELGRHALASLHKGERVIVAGRLKLREWETDSKRGVSADVAADAVGHDLRWGVSRFERDARPEPGPSGSPAAAAPTESDAWAVPGAPDDGSPAPEFASEREPVAVGSGGATPF